MSRGHLVIVGAGIAGLMAALKGAEEGLAVTLCATDLRACGSLMAEGGINAALDPINDSAERHYQDTLKSAQGMVSEKAVRNLTEGAEKIIQELYDRGTQFTMKNGRIAQRPFGGQRRNRTCYAGEETGKQIFSALLDSVRQQMAAGNIRFLPTRFVGLVIEEGRCVGCRVFFTQNGTTQTLLADAVIMACGGLGGLFSCPTTSFHNTADAAGILLKQGVVFSNLEFVQYHPTTARVGGRRILISESARGEGGRLCVLIDGQPRYFMEEEHPELKRQANLLTRDETARACYRAKKAAGQAYLDLRHLPKEVYQGRLEDTLEDCQFFLGLDPSRDLIPVEPGVHYFMGGIQVDENHRTNIPGLYAAGECCAQYHGANRLGGNSLLGAAFGGKVAAKTALAECGRNYGFENDSAIASGPPPLGAVPGGPFVVPLQRIMDEAMGVERDEDSLALALKKLEFSDAPRVLIARAMVASALERRESRGAHFRSDYPEKREEYQKISVARLEGDQLLVEFVEVPR